MIQAPFKPLGKGSSGTEAARLERTLTGYNIDQLYSTEGSEALSCHVQKACM